MTTLRSRRSRPLAGRCRKRKERRHHPIAAFLLCGTIALCAPAGNVSAGISLTGNDFRQIGHQGFGDRGNSYSWSTAWFRGKLFIGTNHHFSCLTRGVLGEGPEGRNPEVPIDCEPDIKDQDFRGRIYAYDPATNIVELRYVSPTARILVSDGSHADVAVDLGYRTMTVFREADGTEALYIGTYVTDFVTNLPPRLLRTTDGVEFAAVPGFVSETPTYTSYRSLTVFKDRLYTIGIGRPGLPTDLLEAGDPASGDFRVVNPPHFGDPVNADVFELAVFKGYLYVGTATLSEGFQLLKTQAVGQPPYVFQKVLVEGAYRGAANQNVVSLQPFGEYLYIGTGFNFVRLDFFDTADPAPAELLRVTADDRWEIVCGVERDTPDGPRAPVSGKGAGCGNLFTGYIWRMAEHEGVLYMGTFDLSVSAQFVDDVTVDDLEARGVFDLYPVLRPLVEHLSPAEIGDLISAFEGGFDLWSTTDGVAWTLISRSGFDDQYNYGVRSFESTPIGLFLGTANPFFGFKLYLGRPADADADGDSFRDVVDNCPITWNLSQNDLDGDGIGDACDPDDDGDCIPDAADPEPSVSAGGLPDRDNDGVFDDCDPDDDNDTVPDRQDNCPFAPGLNQADGDGDGVGDRCENDPDGASDDNDNEAPNPDTDPDPGPVIGEPVGGSPLSRSGSCGAMGALGSAFALGLLMALRLHRGRRPPL